MGPSQLKLAFLGNIGLAELLIIVLVILILFGSRRLPQLGSSIAQAIRNFKDEMKKTDKIDSNK